MCRQQGGVDLRSIYYLSLQAFVFDISWWNDSGSLAPGRPGNRRVSHEIIYVNSLVTTSDVYIIAETLLRAGGCRRDQAPQYLTEQHLYNFVSSLGRGSQVWTQDTSVA